MHSRTKPQTSNYISSRARLTITRLKHCSFYVCSARSAPRSVTRHWRSNAVMGHAKYCNYRALRRKKKEVAGNTRENDGERNCFGWLWTGVA